MATSPALTAAVDQLIDLFNRRSMDLPDGVLTRNTQFLLNGVSFEERMGRSSDDPLVRMLTRGPAGYRFAAKALQHALPDAALQRGDITETSIDGVSRTLHAQCWISGHFRSSGDAADLLVNLELIVEGTSIARASAAIDERALSKLQEARLKP
jgi:hypothetical protein